MRSMTGYSKIFYENENYRIKMEIKSVNNKNLSLKIKMPYILNALENFIRLQVSSSVNRGSIDLRIDFEDKTESQYTIKYDKDLAKSAMNILNEIEDDFKEKFTNKMDFLIRNFSVITKEDQDIDANKYKDIIQEKLEELLKEFIKMKEFEGERLNDFFKIQLKKLKDNLEKIKILQPSVVKNYKNKLLENINSIKNDITFQEEDILREVMIFSDRVDITEEISRAESHIQQLENEFVSTEIDQGKKIEFILQELFREFNTMGVKSNMYEISKIVVDNKNELEKMREQIMNIE